MEPRNCLTRDIRNYGQVAIDLQDRSLRVFLADRPFGRKIQPVGTKCPDTQHEEGMPNMYEDRYKGPRKTYVDRVCKVCFRRMMIV